MKAIFTFVTNGKNLFHDNFGWFSPKYHAYSWVYATNQAEKYFNKIELYCDSNSAEFARTLHLPIDVIHPIYDNLNLPGKLWSVPKIITYSHQKSPFLHLDLDVYFRTSPKRQIFYENLVVQERESNVVYDIYYREALELLTSSSVILPAYMLSKPQYCYNMGLFGGNDIEFIQQYANESLDLIEVYNSFKDFKVLFDLENIDPNNYKGIVSAFIEQYTLTSKCKGLDYKPYCYLPTIGNALYRRGLEHIYQHFFFTQKSDIRKCKMLEKWVMKEYPEYYKLINQIYEDKN